MANFNDIKNEDVKNVINSFTDKNKIESWKVLQNGIRIDTYDGSQPSEDPTIKTKLEPLLSHLKRNGFKQGSQGPEGKFYYFAPSPKSLVILSVTSLGGYEKPEEDYLGSYLDKTGVTDTLTKAAQGMGDKIKSLVPENVQKQVDRIRTLIK